MGLTTDHNDPRLSHGVDTEPTDQAEVYLVMTEEERSKGFIRPLRKSYIHAEALGGCGAVTTMATAIAETYAVNPKYYAATYCVGCRMHYPVSEFLWDGTDQVVGS